ncbi:serine hydrolase domain-containing protein [Kitasatospora griseola]|uniref:serine hydrolase domain-containing protein n=1 Tax=Kitasatospora griseola TaxID=2064 RepID=UPI001F17CCD1|nr:serine hydrolase domain-containing protein [Kitasatospora griseola]
MRTDIPSLCRTCGGGWIPHGTRASKSSAAWTCPRCSPNTVCPAVPSRSWTAAGSSGARSAFGGRADKGHPVVPGPAGGPAEAVTPWTPFQACSLSKPVAVLGVLRLVERGVLDLDADVNGRLAGWRIPSNGDWQPRVTLRRLASHTAGLGTSGFSGYPSGVPVPSLVQVLAGTAPANSPGVRVEGLPGFRFSYSGGGTTVIQLLLESVTGTPVAELLSELVLNPLGMTDSTFARTPTAPFAERAAHGHRGDGTAVPGGWHSYPEQCAAGLWTTPTDLLRHARAVQDAWAGAPDALLKTETARQMLRPHAVLPSGAEGLGGLGHIGLGPYLHMADSDPRWFGHAGSNAGYRCHLLASVETGQGAAVMTNGDAGLAVIGRLLPAIAAAYGWEGLTIKQPYQPVPAAAVASAMGTCTTASGLRVQLRNEPGGPVAVVDSQPAVRLHLSSPTQLLAADLDLLIRIDSPERLILEQDGQSVPCTRSTAS